MYSISAVAVFKRNSGAKDDCSLMDRSAWACRGRDALLSCSSSRAAGSPDQAAKLETLQKKLAAEVKAVQEKQMKALRDDMRKETKRIEAATQSQVRS